MLLIPVKVLQNIIIKKVPLEEYIMNYGLIVVVTVLPSIQMAHLLVLSEIQRINRIGLSFDSTKKHNQNGYMYDDFKLTKQNI